MVLEVELSAMCSVYVYWMRKPKSLSCHLSSIGQLSLLTVDKYFFDCFFTPGSRIFEGWWKNLRKVNSSSLCLYGNAISLLYMFNMWCFKLQIVPDIALNTPSTSSLTYFFTFYVYGLITKINPLCMICNLYRRPSPCSADAFSSSSAHSDLLSTWSGRVFQQPVIGRDFSLPVVVLFQHWIGELCLRKG